MYRIKTSRILLLLNLVLVSSEYLLGCNTAGPTIAKDCSISTGPVQTLTISPTVKASVGEPAIRAAQEAYTAYLNAIPNTALTIAQSTQKTEEAKAKAVSAAEEAKKEAK